MLFLQKPWSGFPIGINGFQQVTPKPDSVYFSDVTGDGKEDALVINNWGTTNRRSDGTKFLPNEDWTTDPYFGANRTYYADVDGDGKADAIVSNEEGVFIRRSDGSKFGADERWTEIGYGGDKGTFFADVTGDGKADAIVVNTINNVGVTVRRSDGTKFLPNELWTDIGYAGKYGIYFADVDGDGKADAIVSNEDGITVRRSDGTKFLPNETWTEIGYGGDEGLFFADATGDGKADAIVVNTINNVGVTVRPSDGTKFLPNELWTEIGYTGEKGTFFADVTGDGRADAIVSNESGVTVRPSDGTKFLPNETWTEIGYGGEGGHGSVVKGSGDAVYLVQGNQRRHIPNPETFNAMRLDWNALQHIADADLNNIPEGDPLPSSTATPVTSPPNASNRLPTSAPQAEPFFKLQYRGTYNPSGPLSSSNCGPASLAMVMDTLGLEPPNISVETSIDHARYLMLPDDSNVQEREGVKVVDKDERFSSWDEIKTGITKARGTPEELHAWDALDQSLASGKPVIANGWYGLNWRNQFPDYSQTGTGNVAHLNAILGKTLDGKYIVADPMYRGGPVVMKRDQLAVFFGGDAPVGLAFAPNR